MSNPLVDYLDEEFYKGSIIYRIIKVLYYTALIVSCLFFGLMMWADKSLAWIIGILISYIILNLIREALMYIFFGKPFDFKYLKELWK